MENKIQRVLIVAPSLEVATNVSGLSAVTNFIIKHNRECKYEHFLQGRSDGESGAFNRVMRIWRNYRVWKRRIEEYVNDNFVIHYNYPLDTPSIVRDYFFMRLARRKGIPMVIHIHGGLYLFKEQKPFFIKWILDRVFSWDNPFIVLSEKEREEIQRQYGTKNVTVLPNCVEIPCVNGNENVNENDNVNVNVNDNGIHILYLGRIEPNKGMDYLLEAMGMLKEKGQDVTLHFAGIEQGKNGYIGRFQELLGDHFIYEGVVSGNRKTELFRRCQVFVLPSLYEGLPMSLLETMSYGLVPVVTDVGSIGEYVKDGVNGLMIGVRDVVSIVNALERLMVDKKLMREMSTAARQTIITRLQPSKYVERLNKIYAQTQ